MEFLEFYTLDHSSPPKLRCMILPYHTIKDIKILKTVDGGDYVINTIFNETYYTQRIQVNKMFPSGDCYFRDFISSPFDSTESSGGQVK